MSKNDPLMVVGIGNPGANYRLTRHNVGIRAVESLGASMNVHKKSGTLLGSAHIDGVTVYLATTTCFMNESGTQVRPLLDYVPVPVERLVIVHDELDLPFGQVKTKKGGGEGGHNGLRSISSHLHTTEYARLRVGISHPGSAAAVTGYVLGKFTSGEEGQLPEIFTLVRSAVEQLALSPFPLAQTHINAPH